MAIVTQTYTGTRVPTTTVSIDTEVWSITAECDLIGLAPSRGVSADESLDGILSLDPPKVTSTGGHQHALELLIRAVASSAYSTPDSGFDIESYGPMVYAVTRGYREALIRATDELTDPEVADFRIAGGVA